MIAAIYARLNTKAIDRALQAQADRFADTVALFQALGGGWWNEAPSAPPQSETKGTVASDRTN